MRICVEGELGFGVAAKDVILYIISKISSQGGLAMCSNTRARRFAR